MGPPSSPPPSAHPKAEAASRPDTSMVEVDGTTKPGPSSSMPPPPPAGSSPPSEAEADAPTGRTDVTSFTVSSSSAYEAENASRTEMADAVPPEQQQPRPRAPYIIPDSSAAPAHPFFLEVIEDGISYKILDLSKKGVYMFGRDDRCDFVLDHSSIADFHAGMSRKQMKRSSRMYFFQGPSELITPVDVTGSAGGGKEMEDAAPPEQQHKPPQLVPYAMPDWSATPQQPFFLQVLKNGIFLERHDVSKKGAYMFGRADLCDFVIDHPSVSGFHAVLQFRNDGDAFLYDLGSIDGSSINKTQIKKKMYTKIRVGDLIQLGQSSCLYLLQGPSELMPPNTIILDREASLSRAKIQTALAEGISCRMSEDAPEESEDEADEIMWQTYKGNIQEKTRGEIVKRMKMLAIMKEETDAIRVQDISEDGLTKGQQTKIARNEQIVSQVLEELINLDETLSDSIQGSLGARAEKRKRGSHKSSVEEEDFSDDDEVYDRTRKRPSNQQSSGHQSVETADSLLEKKDSITDDIEGKKKLLEEEKNKLAQSNDANFQSHDAYMSGLSSQLARDNITKIQNELADPMEETAPGPILRKRKSADQLAGIEAESSLVESKASAADADAFLLKHKRGLQTSEEMDNESEPQASKGKGCKSKQKRLLGPARPDILEAVPD